MICHFEINSFTFIFCLCLYILKFSIYLEYNKLYVRHGYIYFIPHCIPTGQLVVK